MDTMIMYQNVMGAFKRTLQEAVLGGALFSFAEGYFNTYQEFDLDSFPFALHGNLCRHLVSDSDTWRKFIFILSGIDSQLECVCRGGGGGIASLWLTEILIGCRWNWSQVVGELQRHIQGVSKQSTAQCEWPSLRHTCEYLESGTGYSRPFWGRGFRDKEQKKKSVNEILCRFQVLDTSSLCAASWSSEMTFSLIVIVTVNPQSYCAANCSDVFVFVRLMNPINSSKNSWVSVFQGNNPTGNNLPLLLLKHSNQRLFSFLPRTPTNILKMWASQLLPFSAITLWTKPPIAVMGWKQNESESCVLVQTADTVTVLQVAAGKEASVCFSHQCWLFTVPFRDWT